MFLGLSDGESTEPSVKDFHMLVGLLKSTPSPSHWTPWAAWAAAHHASLGGAPADRRRGGRKLGHRPGT